MLLAKFFSSDASVSKFFDTSGVNDTGISLKMYEISSGQVLVTASIRNPDDVPSCVGGKDWFKLNVRKKRFFTINGLNAYLRSNGLEPNSPVDWDSIQPNVILISNKDRDHICYSLIERDLTSNL